MSTEATARGPAHLVVMGVSASGKSTVAELLARQTGRTFAEADEFHSPANVEKMTAGIALTDEDRWPWLRAIRDWLTQRHQAGEQTVVTCSALRHAYRDVLREAAGDVVFVHLAGSREVLEARIGHRGGHFMPASLLPSQLATLEPLADDEAGVTVDIGPGPQEIVDDVVARLGLARAR